MIYRRGEESPAATCEEVVPSTKSHNDVGIQSSTVNDVRPNNEVQALFVRDGRAEQPGAGATAARHVVFAEGVQSQAPRGGISTEESFYDLFPNEADEARVEAPEV